ncbi:CatB-related O-acetyltransferase [Derxia gummosa]|uniref:CatB-related O-acetyltransferase n=1 Tax=Derxia gummosa DSM 723 TaxID=1121388 RepID=A0A8B6X2A7_9BURK|nr:CatB-related O-acetyltransferase [Derxia gummosa]
MLGPSPRDPHPLAGRMRVCFIANVVRHPNVLIGDYTYCDDPDGAAEFERHVLDHLPVRGDRLVIGRYCAIERGVRFLMNGCHTRRGGFSGYPFELFGRGWEKVTPGPAELAGRGDTVVGSDVRLGFESLVLPGVTIGHGAVIGPRAVVDADVPPYAVVMGNPARVVRMRFDAATVERLLRMAWWDWPVARVTTRLEAIAGGDLAALEAESAAASC